MFQLLSGFISFYIALIFCTSINKQLRIFPNSWKSYIPSFEFIIIVVASVGMISSAFLVNEKNYNNEENETKS